MMRFIKYTLDKANRPSKNLTGAEAQLAGGIISGVTNLLGIGSQSKINKQQLQLQREQMLQQQKQFEMQLAYNDKAWQRERNAAIEDFHMENEYNSPAAQRARYEAAGLNPALMMGQGSAIGQMEATNSPTAPSPGGMPSLPNLQAPDFSGFGRSAIDIMNSYFDNRIKQEQAEQLGIDNQTRAVDNIVRINEAIARIDKILSDKNLNDAQREFFNTQREDLVNRIKLFAETYEDQKRAIVWDNNVKIAQWHQINADTKKALTEERILRIEESYKAASIEAGLRLSNAQIKSISQGIEESVKRIEDMFYRRQDDFRSSRENRSNLRVLRQKAREEARLIVRQRLNLDPKSEFGKRQLRLLEVEIYDKLRNLLPFGMSVSHPVTWFGNDFIEGN